MAKHTIRNNGWTTHVYNVLCSSFVVSTPNLRMVDVWHGKSLSEKRAVNEQNMGHLYHLWSEQTVI